MMPIRQHSAARKFRPGVQRDVVPGLRQLQQRQVVPRFSRDRVRRTRASRSRSVGVRSGDADRPRPRVPSFLAASSFRHAASASARH